ncbi:sugar ABC transporter substrate binding protein [Companilactobacillus paralimentarius DSM 13238 = JCM 10415]|jgi:ABC-type polysaccharide transport system, permease component|uniref:Sugar ABC transporter substrate binding protein n=1 Tax=Companilactobacillus paralimentarius DSM 13238 = JCM 10415 TaxID=1122151 RepID=A0A0R1PHA3_9LACO|nr:ABC transporter permease subunit [Companilactobacillus paralimentarius]KAE9562337.1 sugar ABC transporter permease [Companilactobacillus paralimentarius]KRL31734.1 sugar ABC transporter substrate binding protein [Companilactobacillus paralimentarius DSM 13238 = JCM 10415]MDR4934635.1 ABC transporter permease subunit [Companilactobacillus paralimentarius]QFR68778.1 ABC transporter permease subunit [Companilactobacillus paralimentarius]
MEENNVAQSPEAIAAAAKKKEGLWYNIVHNGPFLLFALPGAIWMIFFFYIPVFANVVAFKEFQFSPDGFLASLAQSKWVGFQNFKFLFTSDAAWLITKNTLLYNLGFITLNLIISVFFAIVMSELRHKRLVKVYQTSMLLPYFLSWVIIGYFVMAFLNPDKGLLNTMLHTNINWYAEPKYWPFILLFIGTWKGIGYNSILYFATVMGIDPTYYEAATVDGANKWQQIKNITIPQLVPLMTLMSILAVGNIFRADFGLFYTVPQNSGALYNVTSVLDTYIYNGLTSTGDIGMSSAASLYQSVVGCILLLITNAIVRRLDSDSALF